METEQKFKKVFNFTDEITDKMYLNLICILNQHKEVWISGYGYSPFTSEAETTEELKEDILSYCIDNKEIIKDKIKA